MLLQTDLFGGGGFVPFSPFFNGTTHQHYHFQVIYTYIILILFLFLKTTPTSNPKGGGGGAYTTHTYSFSYWATPIQRGGMCLKYPTLDPPVIRHAKLVRALLIGHTVKNDVLY